MGNANDRILGRKATQFAQGVVLKKEQGTRGRKAGMHFLLLLTGVLANGVFATAKPGPAASKSTSSNVFVKASDLPISKQELYSESMHPKHPSSPSQTRQQCEAKSPGYLKSLWRKWVLPEPVVLGGSQPLRHLSSQITASQWLKKKMARDQNLARGWSSVRTASKIRSLLKENPADVDLQMELAQAKVDEERICPGSWTAADIRETQNTLNSLFEQTRVPASAYFLQVDLLLLTGNLKQAEVLLLRILNHRQPPVVKLRALAKLTEVFEASGENNLTRQGLQNLERKKVITTAQRIMQEILLKAGTLDPALVSDEFLHIAQKGSSRQAIQIARGYYLIAQKKPQQAIRYCNRAFLISASKAAGQCLGRAWHSYGNKLAKIDQKRAKAALKEAIRYSAKKALKPRSSRNSARTLARFEAAPTE